MISYEAFKQAVKRNILNFLPDEYRDYEVRFEKVTKVNRELESVVVLPKDRSKITGPYPNVYLDMMYEHYKAIEDMGEVLEMAANIISQDRVPEELAQEATRKEIPKDCIVANLVNTEQNRELLSSVPHREFNDLSIIYRWVLTMDGWGCSSSIINNMLAEKNGMNEEMLYELAMENTKRLFPIEIRNMEDVMAEMMGEVIKDMAEEVDLQGVMSDIPEEEIFQMESGGIPMYVMSNDRRMNGATSIIYEDELHKFAEKVGDDLYILPSSRHEVIMIPAKNADVNELAQMVYEINMSEVDLEDRLSNQVYHYDREARKVDIATDTPYKRLDDMVAEKEIGYDEPSMGR